MLAKRIIPCLDVKEGRTVKGRNFLDLKDMGDPVELARHYSESGADEITFLDIAATNESRRTIFELAARVSRALSIPFTIGGGIGSVSDAREALLSGADKVAINSAALRSPQLISEIASQFGNQCVVVAIDYLDTGSGYEVWSHGGSRSTGRDALEWIREVTERGAGELLLTAIHRDGTGAGYDTRFLKRVMEMVTVPVIASGGAGAAKDFVSLFQEGAADAALAAGIFHRGEITIGEVKGAMSKNNIPVRL